MFGALPKCHIEKSYRGYVNGLGTQRARVQSGGASENDETSIIIIFTRFLVAFQCTIDSLSGNCPYLYPADVWQHSHVIPMSSTAHAAMNFFSKVTVSMAISTERLFVILYIWRVHSVASATYILSINCVN